jgi:hypothetical protein
MVLVAITGVSAAAFRIHPSLGCFTGGVLCLAAIRTSTSLDRLRAAGEPIRLRTSSRLFLVSTLVASTILVANFVSICLISIFCGWAFFRVDHPGDLEIAINVLASILLSIPIITQLRRRL